MSLFHSARFFTTVVKVAQLPLASLPEVAFVGRSNAGKSSAINALCNRRQLARTSNSPGRTQALNYFALGSEPQTMAYLVDTPGYGYAAAPLEVKRQWDGLAGRYLGQRPQLAQTVLVLDIRRRVTTLDETLLAWVPVGVPVLVLATKADKLGRQEQTRAVMEIEAMLHTLRPDAITDVILFSSDKKIGIERAQATITERLVHWARPPATADSSPM
jgi:GTP-binding protein